MYFWRNTESTASLVTQNRHVQCGRRDRHDEEHSVGTARQPRTARVGGAMGQGQYPLAGQWHGLWREPYELRQSPFRLERRHAPNPMHLTFFQGLCKILGRRSQGNEFCLTLVLVRESQLDEEVGKTDVC